MITYYSSEHGMQQAIHSIAQRLFTKVAATFVGILLVFISDAVLAQSKKLNVSNIRFEHILDKHDVALGAMLTIIQDRQGFIWFGGIGGLARYDGYDLKIMGDTLNANESIKSVHDIAEDGVILWLATSYGLIKFDRRTEQFVRYTSAEQSEIKISQNYINKVAVLPNGKIMLASYGGFDVLDLDTKQVQTLVPDDENTKSQFVFALKVDSKKPRVWLGTSAGLYTYNWKSGKILPISTKTSLDHTAVRAIDFGADNSLWLGTDNGLFHVSHKGKVKSHHVHEADNPNSLGANLIWSVLYDDGYIWAGTDQGGLSIYDEQRKSFNRLTSDIANRASLATNTVKAIFRDRRSDLWVGNFPEGLHYFNKATTAATLYKSNPLAKSSLNHNSVTAFASSNDQGLWIGTDGGGLNYLDFKTQAFKHYAHADQDLSSLRSNAVLALMTDKKGRLWSGTWGGGLARYDAKQDKMIRINLRNTDGGNEEIFNVWSLFEDSAGNIWVGTQTKGLLRWREADSSLVQYRPSDDPTSIAGEAVWSMMEDAAGNFWVGTNQGLNILDRSTGKFTRILHDANDVTSLSHNSIESMLEDSKGRLWFGSVGGLNLYLPASQNFKRITRTNGLVSDSIKSIIEDDSGNLWVGTTNGISKIDGETLTVKNYRPHIGWQKGSFNLGAVSKAKDGTLYFGGPNGFMAFQPAGLVENSDPRTIVITDLYLEAKLQEPSVNDSFLSTALPYANRVKLPQSAQMFSLEFAALDYRASHAIQYRYRLDGFDSQWREVSGKRTATYTNISKGEYQFEVQAMEAEGQWSGSKILVIEMD